MTVFITSFAEITFNFRRSATSYSATPSPRQQQQHQQHRGIAVLPTTASYQPLPQASIATTTSITMPDPSADESTYEEIGYARGEDATAANLNIDQQLESNVSMWSTDDEREAQEEENKLDEATGGASK